MINEVIQHSAFFGLTISILFYIVASAIKKRWGYTLLNPLLLSIIFVIVFLKLLHISYEDYDAGAKYLSYLLTPATVCLAIPLYQQLNLLRKNVLAILVGILSGVIMSMGSIFVISKLLGLTQTEYITLLPKSITTAIGFSISEEMGGIATISMIVIILTGITGNLFAAEICKLLRIREPIAKGIAIGSATHIIGTVKAFEMGEVEGAMSSLSLVIAAILTVTGMPFFAMLH